MGKRPTETRPSHGGDVAKRRKSDRWSEGPTVPQQVHSAQHLQQLLSFRQDSGLELKHGIQSLKAFLDSIAYSDESPERSNRLAVLKAFFEAQGPRDHAEQHDVYLPDLFQTWSYAAQSNNESLLSAVPAVLALLLKTISSLIEFRDYGMRLCRTLLRNDQLKLFARGLTSNRTKEHIISPCVRLLTEIVSYDGGVVARNLYVQRDFTFRRLDVLLSLRRISSEGSFEDRQKPSIRYNAVRYLLANLKFQDHAAKSEILSQGKTSRALFKEIKEDSPEIINDILDVITKHVVLDKALPRNVKSRLLTDVNLGRIATLYNYDQGPQALHDKQKSVDKAAHEFLLLVCTSTDLGVLLSQSGWHPPGTDTESLEFADAEGPELIDLGLDSLGPFDRYHERVPVRNSTLASFLQGLRPYANTMQSELALAIFRAAPELVADYYFRKRSFTLDPKLTPTWLGYSAFVFSSIQLPVPAFCGRQDGYAATPPPTSLVIESILAQPLTQRVLTRCLNQNEELITFFAVRLLTVAFEKLEQVIHMFQASARNTNMWEQASRRLTAEFCRRSPKMKDVIEVFRSSSEDNVQQREAVAKLMVMYYKIVPQIAFEEKFDISLALVNSLSRINTGDEPSEDSKIRLRELENLLQIAGQSPNMRWWHKPESLSLSPFTTVLRLLVERPSGTPLKQIKALLRSILQHNAIIQQETHFSSLDSLVASLQDVRIRTSSAFVLHFLDNCIIRFIQKPVKYYEDLALISDPGSKLDTTTRTGPASLLFATLVEQWPFVAKSTEVREKLNIARWLARYLCYSKQIGEDQPLLAAVRDKLVHSVGDHDCRAVLEDAFKEQREDGFTLKQQIDDQDLRLNSAKESPQTTAPTLDIDEMLQKPQTEDRDHAGLIRWTRKEVQEAIEDGDIGDLVMCFCSGHEEIRKEALVNLDKFMAKLKTSSYVEWEQIYVLLGEFVETTRDMIAERPVPCFAGIFTSRALLVLADPLHFLYGKINKFLNKGPPWRIAKVPSYWIDKVLLHQPEDDDAHQKEVEWLLLTMIDGLRTKEDMEIYRRCSAFERFLSLYSAPSLPASLRKMVIRFIFQATYVDGSTTLITRSGILSWIGVQVRLRDPNDVVLKLLAERCLECCDLGRIDDWGAGTISSRVESIKTPSK